MNRRRMRFLHGMILRESDFVTECVPSHDSRNETSNMAFLLYYCSENVYKTVLIVYKP